MKADAASHEAPVLRELFLKALGRTDARERAAFDRESCGSNPELRRQLEELLREESDIGVFLEEPALAGNREMSNDETVGQLMLELKSENPLALIGQTPSELSYQVVVKAGFQLAEEK